VIIITMPMNTTRMCATAREWAHEERSDSRRVEESGVRARKSAACLGDCFCALMS
jgi:hypothetical protein